MALRVFGSTLTFALRFRRPSLKCHRMKGVCLCGLSDVVYSRPDLGLEVLAQFLVCLIQHQIPHSYLVQCFDCKKSNNLTLAWLLCLLVVYMPVPSLAQILVLFERRRENVKRGSISVVTEETCDNFFLGQTTNVFGVLSSQGVLLLFMILIELISEKANVSAELV